MDEEVLAGGIANAGAMTRVGSHVLRPANSHSESIHGFDHGHLSPMTELPQLGADLVASLR